MSLISNTSGKSAIARSTQPRISVPGCKFATVLVGGMEKRFVVHESLLKHYSKFFRAALTSNFKEAEDKTVKLSETKSMVFEFFVHWLYYQRFPDGSLGDDEKLVRLWGLTDPRGAHSDRFLDLYVFGDKYDVPQLRIQFINGLNRCMESSQDALLPSTMAITMAFNSLQSDDPMCRLVIELCCHWSHSSILKGLSSFDCAPFLRGVWHPLAEFIENDQKPRVNYFLDICDFHDHETDEEKANCRSVMDHEISGIALLRQARALQFPS